MSACLLSRTARSSTHSLTKASRTATRGARVIATSTMAPYTLYTWATPNGWKASIALEELGLNYDVKALDIGTSAVKEPEYTAINPNGRIPALVDHENNDLKIFESGAIMWYLVQKLDKSGQLWPKDFNKQAEVMSWLMFQMGGVGPMQGQSNHFVRYAPEKLFYAMNRYVNETKRLYGVMDKQLASHEWLAADQYSIADIANFSWVYISAWSGVDRADFPHLKKWFEKILERPAVKKGLLVPHKGNLIDKMVIKEQYDSTYKDALDALSQAKAASGK